MHDQPIAPIPVDEEFRLATLRSYEILDTDQELAFEDLVALASHICEAPISAISLVDSDRQWFKASIGLDERETPRNISFCQHTVMSHEVVVVPDALEDSRFKDSPLVKDGPKVRFYAGAPLVAPDGSAIGALCIKDTKPRTLSEEQVGALQRLARQVVDQMELRKLNSSLHQRAQALEHQTEELKKGEERFKLVCRATDDVIWDLDLETGHTWVSPNYLVKFGPVSSGTSPTMEEWIEAIHPDDRSHTVHSFQDALKSGASSWQGEYLHRLTDGSYAYVLDRAFVMFDENQRPIRAIGAITDMSTRKQAELDRHERENAERANHAKSEFLSRMSHELRTPLNSILGFAQLLDMYQPTDQQRECIQRILSGGQHLLGLINEVLDLSRIESGNMELSVEPVKISAAVQEAMSLTHPLAKSRGITVEKREDADDNLFALADRQRLLQVLINLISNGIKYNLADGRVEIGYYQTEERIAITIRDNGKGIGKDLAHRVFMPFDRLGIEQREQVEGTGLGLALSKNLTEAMGGELTFSSQVGLGTIFTIDLAFAEEPIVQSGPLETEDITTPEQTRSQILYIEDNESNVALMQSVISSRPLWNLKVAKTGNEGLRLATEAKPDVLLLDLDLPDISGYEILIRLRADDSFDNTPILIVSADATHDRIDRLIAAGANGYVTKPFDVRDLLRQVTDLLNKEVACAA